MNTITALLTGQHRRNASLRARRQLQMPTVTVEGAYSSELFCNWLSWTALRPGVLRLILPDGDHPDMRSTLALAGMLMPAVHEVRVIVGEEPEMMFRLIDAEWFVFERTQEQ